MTTLKKVLARLGHTTDQYFDELKHRLNQRLGRGDPLQIVPYLGYGTTTTLFITGRLLEERGLRKPTDDDSLWDNLLATYQRFETDEVPGVRIQAQFKQVKQEAITDDEGYFALTLTLPQPLQSPKLWHDIQLKVVDQIQENQGLVEATGQVLIPPHTCEYGVISDIDDTVLQTNATNLLRVAKLTFLNNAHTRLPFEGVAAFYQALQQGASGQANNPIFYLSSSPWNLYDLLLDFLEIQKIPKGPLLLQDYGIDAEKFIHQSHHNHKRGQIERLLNRYPHLPFILIGDSGQQDAEIYHQVVIDFPNRIKAIYIRNVTDEVRGTTIKKIAEETVEHGIDLVLATDSLEAARSAAANGYIRPDQLAMIEVNRNADAAAPTDLEQLL